MFRSIRWRLPLSYAAIALIATVALGIVLLSTVRNYYARQELDYLASNARAMGKLMAETLVVEAPTEVIKSQLANLAFLSQAQLRVLDVNRIPLATSDISDTVDVLIASVPLPDKSGEPFLRTMIFVGGGGEDASMIASNRDELPFEMSGTARESVPAQRTDRVFVSSTAALPGSTFVVAGSSLGFRLDEKQALPQRRSDQIIVQTLTDRKTGQVVGYLELSRGPAYGVEIVENVARGWLMAGSIAVIIAAVIGWWISLRITQPVLQLTAVTQHMAEGDLSNRAVVKRRDELGTLAQSFNEMADQVEATITTLRRFVSDAAHELHSPLTALQADLELSVSEQDETRRTALIAQAQQQTIRLRELADNLLDLSRVEAHGARTLHELVNLNDLLYDLSEPYASQADQAGLALQLDLPPEPIKIQGDAGQLHRAIGNLIDNAIKFTPEGGAITIGLRQDAGTSELCIQDTGIGIPEEDLPHLFSRFHRGRNVAGYPGNGLGLAIVKAIIEAHGGRVSAANTSPGARFCITLPEAR
ncbi:two-component system, OmpR family, sensor histidine kinase BaeS [Thermoflexales bacterium]|nr:two-component system, OmpR family, sensor histidine kinase BaeS [Thermoflexales bacterium]